MDQTHMAGVTHATRVDTATTKLTADPTSTLFPTCALATLSYGHGKQLVHGACYRGLQLKCQYFCYWVINSLAMIS